MNKIPAGQKRWKVSAFEGQRRIKTIHMTFYEGVGEWGQATSEHGELEVSDTMAKRFTMNTIFKNDRGAEYKISGVSKPARWVRIPVERISTWDGSHGSLKSLGHRNGSQSTGPNLAKSLDRPGDSSSSKHAVKNRIDKTSLADSKEAGKTNASSVDQTTERPEQVSEREGDGSGRTYFFFDARTNDKDKK